MEGHVGNFSSCELSTNSSSSNLLVFKLAALYNLSPDIFLASSSRLNFLPLSSLTESYCYQLLLTISQQLEATIAAYLNRLTGKHTEVCWELLSERPTGVTAVPKDSSFTVRSRMIWIRTQGFFSVYWAPYCLWGDLPCSCFWWRPIRSHHFNNSGYGSGH